MYCHGLILSCHWPEPTVLLRQRVRASQYTHCDGTALIYCWIGNLEIGYYGLWAGTHSVVLQQWSSPVSPMKALLYIRQRNGLPTRQMMNMTASVFIMFSGNDLTARCLSLCSFINMVKALLARRKAFMP